MKHKAFPIQGFKALDETQGIFEAIVAVFNNVDHGGDKIIPGAFKGSLQRWAQKNRPIPVIFSHEWENLDAHIGEVLEAKEVADGLYIKAQLEMDEPFAARVWKKMRKRTLAEFSFAYDELDARIVDQGDEKQTRRFVNELHELELYEVGPCLVGMNRDTQLLDVKAAQKANADAIGIGDSDNAGNDEGQTGADGDGDPSGPPPCVVSTQIEIDLLEV